MSTPFIVPQKNGTQHREKLHRKHCQFPGCKEYFMGTGKSKYCNEHRKRKYRKIIDAEKIARQKAEEEARNPNQIIHHEFTDSTKMKIRCALDGCENEFTIKVIPKVYVYPKYCKEHRNAFKRERFINAQK